MVDDVLEILINSGELPPSAAQEPVTPTTPNRQMTQGLVLSALADSATESAVFAATPNPTEVTKNKCCSSAPDPQLQPSPLAPSTLLPLTTLTVQLPNVLQQQQRHNKLTEIAVNLLNAHLNLDTKTVSSPQSIEEISPDPQPPQEVTSSNNANLNLKVSFK